MWVCRTHCFHRGMGNLTPVGAKSRASREREPVTQPQSERALFHILIFPGTEADTGISSSGYLGFGFPISAGNDDGDGDDDNFGGAESSAGLFLCASSTMQGQGGLSRACCTLWLLHCFWDKVPSVTALRSAKQWIGCSSYRWLAVFASYISKMPEG